MTTSRQPDMAAVCQSQAAVSQAQGIEAEIPQADRREAEELKRKARSPRRGDAPKIQMSDEE
jgi:hypothetical protein